MVIKPFFSIIIPLYNKEDYIEATLISILNQTFTDFEVIIVNDGSTDSSLEKTKNIISNFENHIIINQKNKGLSASRNKGISKAKGEVIALIDADDLWHENFLKSIFSLYSNFPNASFYGTDYLEKYDEKNTLETKKNLDANLKNKEFEIDDFFFANKFQSIICQSCIAFKKNIIKENAFDETIDYAEDVDFYLKNFTKYKLAYLFTPMATILSNVPNQITKIGIKNKSIPDLNKYERKNPNNNSLKQYLDFKRYMYATQYKLDGDRLNFNYLTKHLNYNNLSNKQRILLKSPLFLLKLFKAIKKLFLKYNIRLTSVKN